MLGVLSPLAIPQLDGLLVGIIVVAGALVAIGLVHIARGFATGVVGGIGQLFHLVPVVGHFFEGGITLFEQWVVSGCTAAETFLDGVISEFWHDLSRLASWLWHELSAGASANAIAIQVLQASAIAGVGRRLASLVAQTAHGLELRVGVAQRQVDALGAELGHAGAGRIGAATAEAIRPLEASIEALGGRLTGSLGRVDRELGVTIPGEFGGLHEWAERLTNEIAAMRARVAALEAGAVAVTSTAAVAVAMRELGTEWTRCRNWRSLGRRFCGLPGGLVDGLLEGAVDALIVANLCDFAGLVEDAAIALEPVLEELVALQGIVCLFGGASLPSGIVAADRRRSTGFAAGVVAADLTA